ncbi:30S ribosomal protein S13 [Candidatus Micrarchaeota archaeon]|nr:30S ribosomal protein S13 [Candidatus Micrarchaeota archaeon]
MAKKVPKKTKKPEKEENENFRGIVRIAGKDVNGKVTLKRALHRVRGIGHTMAHVAALAITKELSLDPLKPIGEYTEADIEKIDKILFSMQDHNVPSFLLNRCKDFNSGDNKHVIMNDLIFEVNQDVDRDKKMYSWKGYRHSYGQKVRGQKTRNTGRSGMALGVLRKSIIAAQGGAKEPAKEKK